MNRATCSHCGKSYTIEDHLAGKTVRCKSCGKPFAVPAPQPTPAPQSSPAPQPTPALQPTLDDRGFRGPLDHLIAATPSTAALEAAPPLAGPTAWNVALAPPAPARAQPFDLLLGFCRAYVWALVDLAVLAFFGLFGYFLMRFSPEATVLVGLPLVVLAGLGLVVILGGIGLWMLRSTSETFGSMMRVADASDVFWLLISPTYFGYRVGAKARDAQLYDRQSSRKKKDSEGSGVMGGVVRICVLPLVATIGFVGGAYLHGPARPAPAVPPARPIPGPHHAPMPPFRNWPPNPGRPPGR
jgi:predicted Zn finger-like uncharacterized protein